MKPTDISAPDYFHKVVDCQWACPAHTPVPEYIRLIAEGRYSDAYMINWRSNVFPGVLGRPLRRSRGQWGSERFPGRARPPPRPPLRAGLPPGAGRGRAGGDLPPEA